MTSIRLHLERADILLKRAEQVPFTRNESARQHAHFLLELAKTYTELAHIEIMWTKEG